jgi:putative FmdB family regulatory protein
MPTYEYVCESCGHDMEVFQSMSEDPLKQCPSCETPALKRKIGLGAGIIFKGGGFYETDFKDRKGSSASGNSESKKESEKPAQKKSGTDKASGSGD